MNVHNYHFLNKTKFTFNYLIVIVCNNIHTLSDYILLMNIKFLPLKKNYIHIFNYLIVVKKILHVFYFIIETIFILYDVKLTQLAYRNIKKNVILYCNFLYKCDGECALNVENFMVNAV